MALGPGKYDHVCTLVRSTAGAEGVAVIVINGHAGNGYSVQAPLDVLSALPALLRRMADEIEREHAGSA